MLARILILPLLLVCACSGKPWIWDVWPLTPTIVRKSTHAITGLHATTGELVKGSAFVIGHGHLVTSEAICMTTRIDSLLLDVRGTAQPVTMAQLYEGLCLVKTAARLDNALLIARTMPLRDGSLAYVTGDGAARRGRRISRAEISAPWRPGLAGSPVVDGCGVVGVVIGPRVSGEPGARVVTLGALQRFLDASGVRYEQQPDGPGDLDMGGHPWPDKDHDDERDGDWPTAAPRPAQRGGCR